MDPYRVFDELGRFAIWLAGMIVAFIISATV